MSRVTDSNRYPRRLYNEIPTEHTYLQHNTKPPAPIVKADTYMKHKTPTDVKFVTKPDNFNSIKPKIIYPEDEDLSPPVYRQVIDQQMVNIAGKYYKRTDLTGKLSTR